jgi:hypothetical protein
MPLVPCPDRECACWFRAVKGSSRGQSLGKRDRKHSTLAGGDRHSEERAPGRHQVGNLDTGGRMLLKELGRPVAKSRRVMPLNRWNRRRGLPSLGPRWLRGAVLRRAACPLCAPSLPPTNPRDRGLANETSAVVELTGVEPVTSCLPSKQIPRLALT